MGGCSTVRKFYCNCFVIIICWMKLVVCTGVFKIFAVLPVLCGCAIFGIVDGDVVFVQPPVFYPILYDSTHTPARSCSHSPSRAFHTHWNFLITYNLHKFAMPYLCECAKMCTMCSCNQRAHFLNENDFKPKTKKKKQEREKKDKNTFFFVVLYILFSRCPHFRLCFAISFSRPILRL